ncbi:MAG: acylphosphatase [Methanogenium sp.]|jgi:acylphosphatase
MRRATAIVSGRIQAVGYRNIVDTVAYTHKITGYVKNLKDRTVEVVAEGHESSLKAFFDDIRIDESPIHVDTISITWDDPTNEYTYFDIIRGDPSEEIGERMDVANILLMNMNKKQDIMILKQDIMIDKQDQMLDKQDIMIDKQDQMLDKQDQMLDKQDQMLDKQDQMLDKQDQMLDVGRETKDEITGLRKDTGKFLDDEFKEIKKELHSIKDALSRAGIKV